MTALAILTQGTTFSLGSGPTVINGVQSVTGVGAGKAKEIETTTLASTAKEFRMGLQDFGSFNMSFIWDKDDAGQALMYTAMSGQLPEQFIMVLPSTNPTITLHTFTAQVYVTSISQEIQPDGIVKGSATFRITGLPVWS